MGTLYVVATPIGNYGDVSARAIEVLSRVQLVAAEDTRVTGRLLAAKSLRKPMLSYRAPVERRSLSRLLEALAAGDVALVSDAGTPSVSDPGQKLVSAAWEAGRIAVNVAWPYANGPRHIGHVAGYGVPSDVFARYQRLRGNRVLMVSGTDEHGSPITFGADAEGIPPKAFADLNNRIIVEDQ